MKIFVSHIIYIPDIVFMVTYLYARYVYVSSINKALKCQVDRMIQVVDISKPLSSPTPVWAQSEREWSTTGAWLQAMHGLDSLGLT